MFSAYFAVSARDAKQLLRILAIPQGLIIEAPLSRESTVGTLETTIFREITNLIPFHEFLILF